MEYRSSASLLGLPVVHVVVGARGPAGRGVRAAKGWIAIGDVAFGALLAIGGLAVGGIALGGCGVGLISLGGLSLGLLALGGLALGGWAVGGCAVAFYSAAGGLAVARMSAVGGAAVAGRFALGGAAFAQHANDAAAKEFFEKDSFYGFVKPPMEQARWLVFLALLPALMAFWRLLQKRREEP